MALELSRPIWSPAPERVRATRLAAFASAVDLSASASRVDYPALHRWSVEEPEAFWRAIWEFTGVLGSRGSERILVDGHRMPGARWFPDARLNFAENLLRRNDDGLAIAYRSEDGRRGSIAFSELRDRVWRVASALRSLGVGVGDRVAGVLPNGPEAVEIMLATSAIGAVWSSCSPDFGVDAIVDRFGQIEPVVLFGADGWVYGGKRFDGLTKLAEIASALPSLRRLVVASQPDSTLDLSRVPDALLLEDFVASEQPQRSDLERFPFDHPLAILYSSGTTGKPKCIVHGAGGTLLQHLKEHQLHCDIRRGDRVFYYTTCGWMMWNWLVSALASEATVLLYDGSPFAPETALFDLAEETRTTFFGVSAKFIDAATKRGLEPAKTHRLDDLRTIGSTGSPLSPEGFDWVYEKVKGDVCLSSISGGTDILSCFVGGNPAGPVWRGEIQAPGLGMRVEAFDESGEPVTGKVGELVCTAPFPSMPIGFWNDPNDERFHAAYFERFPEVWHHGDLLELTDRGTAIIHGRSDAVLNPGGVRIGTAEIYRHVEHLDRVVECVAVGQSWEADVRIVLFVRLREGDVLEDELAEEIRVALRRKASPRHVPARIFQVADIPRTKNGKVSELAVRETIHSRPVRNTSALENPECLEEYRTLVDELWRT